MLPPPGGPQSGGVCAAPAGLDGFFFFCGSAPPCRNRESERLALVCWEASKLLRCLVTVVTGSPSTSEDLSAPSGSGLESGAGAGAGASSDVCRHREVWGGEELLSCSQISAGAPRCCSTFLLLLFLPGAPPSGCFSATARFFLPLLFLGASAPASSFAVWPPEEVRPRWTASSAAGAASAPPPGATGGDPGRGLWALAGLEADLLLPGT